MGNATTTRTGASGAPTLTWGPGVAPGAGMVGRTLHLRTTRQSLKANRWRSPYMSCTARYAETAEM
jgi:hypothetical protein